MNGMKYKEIAEKYDVSLNTVKSWQRRYNWSRKGAPNKKKMGAPKNNQNARGNKGGAAPKGNKNAATHGLFANWLPDESRELMELVADRSPADMIWDNIMIQYTAIIRAQKIMYVSDRDDISKEISSSGESVTEYAIQYAWDKQANFMAAQSRAMTTLSHLIKQFVSLTDEQDERRKKLAIMDVQVKKAKAEAEMAEIKTAAMKDNDNNTENKVAVLLEKINDEITEGGDKDRAGQDLHNQTDPSDARRPD